MRILDSKNDYLFRRTEKVSLEQRRPCEQSFRNKKLEEEMFKTRNKQTYYRLLVAEFRMDSPISNENHVHTVLNTAKLRREQTTSSRFKRVKFLHMQNDDTVKIS